MNFEAVIGLEVHCQLATESKIFCGCRVLSDESVNAHVCPICAGHPGTLPVLNKKAVEFAIRAGLATQCTIRPKSVFARKNYFYPDLPKGYQISQYDQPLCENGFLDLEFKDGRTKRVGIQRIHMEEDAGKNVHMSGFSLVNLNRAGVPLIEIVSGPDFRSPEEAGAYLRALHAIVTYLDISDGNMQEGNFRCDANVSIRPVGATAFGTRVEIKNVNSFRFVEKAIEYETARQIEVVKAGGKVTQETRLYDSAKNVTQTMRSKEEAHDYRYFPEPDLIQLTVEPRWIEAISASLPELPAQKRKRFVSDWGLSSYDAGVVTGSKSMSVFFDETVAWLRAKGHADRDVAKPVANLLTGEVARLCNEENRDIPSTPLKPDHIGDLVLLAQAQTISSTAAKQVLGVLWKDGGQVAEVVDRLGLRQVSDTSALDGIVDQVLQQHPDQVAQFKSGKDKLLGFFVGQVMQKSGGKANPGVLQTLIRKKLGS